MISCDARLRLGIGRSDHTNMLSELAKLAVASTAVTALIWVLSLLAPRCVPEHVGGLIRFAAC
jgi:hypothetical protein